MRVVKDFRADFVYARDSNLNPVQTLAFPSTVTLDYRLNDPPGAITAVPTGMDGPTLRVKSVGVMLSWDTTPQNNFGLGVFSITFDTTGVPIAQGATMTVSGFWNNVFDQHGFENTLLSTAPFCFCHLAADDGTVAVIQLQGAGTPNPPGTTIFPDLLVTFVTAAAANKTYYGSESIFPAVPLGPTQVQNL